MRLLMVLLLVHAWLLPVTADPAREDTETSRLVAALLADTPLIEDLRSLTDEIGGRPTGSAANLRSVQWALERFRAAGVAVRKEAFEVPTRWLERSAAAQISGDAEFAARVAAMPYSVATSDDGVTATLVDGGAGYAIKGEPIPLYQIDGNVQYEGTGAYVRYWRRIFD